ncbi:putative ABC transporter ATP-binding protein [compost metagenome]
MLIAEGRVREFDGDLDDYLAWLAARRDAGSAAHGGTGPAAERVARKGTREIAAAERQQKLARRRPLLREADELERELAAWHEEKRELDEQLADPAFYASPDPDQLKGVVLRQQAVTRRIDEAEHRWLEVHAALEAMGEG